MVYMGAYLFIKLCHIWINIFILNIYNIKIQMPNKITVYLRYALQHRVVLYPIFFLELRCPLTSEGK
jgi:hypothetical protein